MGTADSRYGRCMYFVSNALARRTEKLAIDVWKQVELSPSHAYLLMLVLEEPGIQPGGLSAELRLTPSTITRLVEKLEEKRLLIRTTEGKITNIYPTPKAKELLPAMKRCLVQFTERYATIMGDADHSRLLQQMGSVADKLGE